MKIELALTVVHRTHTGLNVHTTRPIIDQSKRPTAYIHQQHKISHKHSTICSLSNPYGHPS